MVVAMSSILDLRLGEVFFIGVHHGPQCICNLQKHPHYGVLIYNADDALVHSAAVALYNKLSPGAGKEDQLSGITSFAKVIQDMLSEECGRALIDGYENWKLLIVTGESETRRLDSVAQQLGFKVMPAEFVD